MGQGVLLSFFTAAPFSASHMLDPASAPLLVMGHTKLSTTFPSGAIDSPGHPTLPTHQVGTDGALW